MIFIELAGEVVEGEVQHFDEWILKSLRNPVDLTKPKGPQWLYPAMRDITALGGLPIISLLTAVVLGFLYLQKDYRSIKLVLAATLGGMLIVIALKYGFGRERPTVVPHLMIEKTPSFPSAHSTMSAVFYLPLAALFACMQTELKIRIYIISMGLFFTFLIGISRIYLGVHYPTDVLAGWAVGSAWASLCWFTASYYNTNRV
ncbi:MAG: phosphatase PAP2 family protein [Desulfobacterales bacterium]|nr:phosphatase PAP2 family protein [Desulfobacterales bacterium]